MNKKTRNGAVHAIAAVLGVVALGCSSLTPKTVSFPVQEPDGKTVEVSKFYATAIDETKSKSFELLQQGKTDDALAMMKASVPRDGGQAYTHWDLAIIYEIKGDWANADTEINEGLKIMKNDSDFMKERDFIERHQKK